MRRTRMGSVLGGGCNQEPAVCQAGDNRNDVDSRPNRSVALIEIAIQVRWHSVIQEAIQRGASDEQMRESEFEGRRDLIEIVTQAITIKIQ